VGRRDVTVAVESGAIWRGGGESDGVMSSRSRVEESSTALSVDESMALEPPSYKTKWLHDVSATNTIDANRVVRKRSPITSIQRAIAPLACPSI
jgi:hypothetical protein